MKYDVVVVGGGHSGLYGAAKLAEQGLRVALIEKKKFIGERVVCTGIISQEAFDKYGLPEDTIVGNIQNIRFHSPSNQFFDYKPSKKLARIVNRTQFNRYFENKALRQGVEIFTSSKVEKVKVREDGVQLKVTHAVNEESWLDSEMLILATGVNYKLFHEAGIQLPEAYLGGAQITVPWSHDDFTSIYSGTEVAPGAFGWAVPVEGGVARVGLLSDKNAGTYLKRLLDRIKPGWRDDTPETQMNLRPVLQGPLERSYNHRVLVVGEAAGQIKTTTGGGIYYSMLGVDVACEVLKTAFKRKRFSADVLSSYDKRWKKIMAEELRIGLYFRSVFAKWTDDQIEEAFDRLVQKELLALAYESAEFDWHKGLLWSVTRIPTFKKMISNPF